MGGERLLWLDVSRGAIAPRRLTLLLSAILCVGLLCVSGAKAVPGGPTPEDEPDWSTWLAGTHGAAMPHAGNGSVGTLNSSGVNSASANQVNDPSLDVVQSFAGAPPFDLATESETSMAAAGRNVVVGYNSTAGTVFTDAFGDISQLLLDGVSVSHDGGSTWHSGFIPAEPGAPPNTYGDPSLAADRAGNFYYASLSWFGIQIAKSTDGGDTWSTTNVAPVYFSGSNSPDKEWLAVGPDPTVRSRDDLYITWTQFVNGGSRLEMSRSLDGGAHWSAPKVLFTPKATSVMSNEIQDSNPVVDPATGRLYVPFLHYSNIDADDIRVLVSDDAGKTFRFLTFNEPGAPDSTAFMNVTPGSYTDCGVYGGHRLTIHQGTATAGRSGAPRWTQATRISTQPATAVAGGHLFIALGSSTSPYWGNGSGSEIRVLYSPDGGTTWSSTVTAVPSTSAEPQHFHPAITADGTGSHLQVVSYAQQASGQVSVEAVSGTVSSAGVSFGASRQLEAPSDLPPTNITVSSNVADPTYNYDAVAAPCYGLGEYLSTTQAGASAVAAWGADRQVWKEPAGALIGGVHSQQDVFFGSLGS